MSSDNLSAILKRLETFILKEGKKFNIPDIMLRRSLNETWFSDTLAWLLDPKTGDEFGVIFVNNFIKRIAEKRSNSIENYKRKESFLRYRDQKAGRTITGKNKFSLKNIAVMREFYLSKFDYKKKKGSAQFADIALFDLDSNDGVFITIENKLFTTNHPQQLETYYKLIEDKYSSVKTREYVYLTLRGDEPIVYENNSDKKILKHYWIRFSWIGDILEILQKSINEVNNTKVPEDVRRLEAMLSWLKDMICLNKSICADVEEFLNLLINNATKVLTAHLKRLSVEGREWSQKEKINSSIVHSSIPKRVLYVQMLPNLSITIQGKTRSKKYYEKIFIPFGAYPDQVFHLIYMAARDVYYKHFDNPKLYLNEKKKLTKEKLGEEKKIESLLFFIYKYKFQLQVLLSSTKLIKNANIYEETREHIGEEEAENAHKLIDPENTEGDE